MLEPAAATFCQLCPADPGTNVAVDKPTVGVTQLTSDTSVDPPIALVSSRAGSISATLLSAGAPAVSSCKSGLPPVSANTCAVPS